MRAKLTATTRICDRTTPMSTREELYTAVWTEPLRKLAERFQVSDSYLARVCDSLNIPRPKAGYWIKKDAGKASPPPPLPPALAGEPTEWHPGGGVIVRRSVPRVKQAREHEAPNARPKTHDLIQGAMGDFLKTRRLDDWWDYLRPYRRNLVDITVSQTSLKDALAFANALFIAIEAKGHRVGLIDHGYGVWRRRAFGTGEKPVQQEEHNPNDRSWAPGRLTVVQISGHLVGLALVEVATPTLLRYVGNSTYVREADYVAPKGRSRYTADTWTTTRDCPTGRLRLVAYGPHRCVDLAEHWQENGKSRLLARLPDIVAGIEAFGARMPALVAEGDAQLERERRQYEAEERQRAIRENQRRIEESTKQSREQLDALIHRWAEIRARAEFLERLEQDITRLPESERASLEERLALARELIGATDPMPHFRAWRSPAERYSPRHFEDDE